MLRVRLWAVETIAGVPIADAGVAGDSIQKHIRAIYEYVLICIVVKFSPENQDHLPAVERHRGVRAFRRHRYHA